MASSRAASSWARRARPLHGRRIVVTPSYEPLDRAIQALGSYHWIIFTSANAVAHFWARFQKLEQEMRLLQRVRIAAIGPKTAKALANVGLKADLVPREYRAEAILEELQPEEIRARRILLPRAAEARDILPNTLRQWGAVGDEIAAYRTVAAKGDGADLRAELLDRKIDMVTF